MSSCQDSKHSEAVADTAMHFNAPTSDPQLHSGAVVKYMSIWLVQIRLYADIRFSGHRHLCELQASAQRNTRMCVRARVRAYARLVHQKSKTYYYLHSSMSKTSSSYCENQLTLIFSITYLRFFGNLGEIIEGVIREGMGERRGGGRRTPQLLFS